MTAEKSIKLDIKPLASGIQLWAVLIARNYEVFPLLCPICGGQMRLIAFITEGTQTGKILDHIGEDSEPPHIAPARGPPLWGDCDAQVGDGVQSDPNWDLAAQPAQSSHRTSPFWTVFFSW